jgi:hypothetical protein
VKSVSPPSAEYGDRPPEVARAGSGAAQRSARWPKWLRRGPMEMVASIVIALGFLMMLQPFALVLFTWSFVTTLAGVVLFTIVSKFPQ